jgi:hypothetical protein
MHAQDPRDPAFPDRILTHALREQLRQRAEHLVRQCGIDYLKLVRARLADMLESELAPEHRETLQIRGLIVHEEIQRRESTPDTLAQRLRRGFGAPDPAILKELTKLPPLPPRDQPSRLA